MSTTYINNLARLLGRHVKQKQLIKLNMYLLYVALHPVTTASHRVKDYTIADQVQNIQSHVIYGKLFNVIHCLSLCG